MVVAKIVTCANRMRTLIFVLQNKNKQLGAMKEIGLKIDQFCQTYFNELTAITKEKPLTLEPNDAFVLNVIDNAVENFSGAGKLLVLSEPTSNAYLKNSACILLRKSLSDIIMLCWIFESNSDEELTARILTLRNDHPKYYVSYLKKMNSLNLIEFSELKHELDILNQLYGDLFSQNIEYDFSNYSAPQSIPISQMLNEGTKKNPALVEAYKTYSLFSKLEHSGVFSKLIMDDIYQVNSQMDEHIKGAIFTIEKTLLEIVGLIMKYFNFESKLPQLAIIK